MSMNITRFTSLSLLALISVLTGCEQQAPETQEPVLRPVRTMMVQTAEISRQHEFSAVVEANRSADLSFKISGELVEVLVKEGDEVMEGQVLARLDDTDVKIELDEAQSGFDKSDSEFERAKELIKTSTISQADFEQVQANFNTARAKLSAAQNKFDYTKLEASFSGVIAKIYTDKLQELNAKTPVIALHDLTNIDLKIAVPESIMVRVRKDEEPPELIATFENIPNREFPLTFKEVATQADDVTKTYDITLTMPMPENINLLPGMTGQVTAKKVFPEDEFNASFYLPVKTVLQDSNGHYVYVVTQVSEGVGSIERRNVTVGRITTLGIEVFSGVISGDQILTAGMSKVSPGMQVKL